MEIVRFNRELCVVKKKYFIRRLKDKIKQKAFGILIPDYRQHPNSYFAISRKRKK